MTAVNATIETSEAITHDRTSRLAVKIVTKIHKTTLGWVQRITLGSSATNKLRILGIAILQSANKITKKRISSLDRKINAMHGKINLCIVTQPVI